MSRAARIREWLRANPTPCTVEAIAAAREKTPNVIAGAAPAEIAIGLGVTGSDEEASKERHRIYWSVGLMFNDGILDREGVGRAMRYFLVREPASKRLPEGEAQRRRRERQRQRMARIRGVALEPREPIAPKPPRESQSERRRKHREEKKRERAELNSRKEASRASSRASEQAARARGYLYRGGPKARPKPVPPKSAPVKVQPSARLAPAKPPKPVLQRMESVAEFEARGGRVEHLPGPWERAA